MKKIITLAVFFLLSSAFNSANAFWFKNDYTQTKYPLVFAHGMLGFDKIGSVDYWYGIPQALERSGADVHITQMSAMNSSEVRAEQLLKQVEEILATTGAEKVNLIGHSHGTHAIRYVAAIMPERIASVTAIGGPIKGSPVAGFIKNILENKHVNKVSPHLFNAVSKFGGLINRLAGEELPQDSEAGMNSLTLEGTADFNRRFPAGVPTEYCAEGEYLVNGVRYYSWSGVGASNGVTNIFDPLSWAMVALVPIFKDEQTDGLVSRCSSHLGEVIRDDYNMDHLDEVNQAIGLVHLFSTNPVSVYRQHANRLKRMGF